MHKIHPSQPKWRFEIQCNGIQHTKLIVWLFVCFIKCDGLLLDGERFLMTSVTHFEKLPIHLAYIHLLAHSHLLPWLVLSLFWSSLLGLFPLQCPSLQFHISAMDGQISGKMSICTSHCVVNNLWEHLLVKLVNQELNYSPNYSVMRHTTHYHWHGI